MQGVTDPLVQTELVISTEEYCLMAGNNDTDSPAQGQSYERKSLVLITIIQTMGITRVD